MIDTPSLQVGPGERDQVNSQESKPMPQEADQNAPRRQVEEEPKRLSIMKKIWTKIDLDLPTFLLMVKGSLPPLIALAMYQSKMVAEKYDTLGYLIAIISILSFCILPRGKFIQTIVLNSLSTCIAAAVNLLALYCAVEARKHTTPVGAPPIEYNSSASAVCAIFLILQLYIVNVLRGAMPQLQRPVVIYSIFLTVCMTFGVVLPDMASVMSLIKQLIETFLTGLGIATAVNIVVFPMSSRKIVFKEMTSYLLSLTAILEAQVAYMQSLQAVDPVANRMMHRMKKNAAHESKRVETQPPPPNSSEMSAAQQLQTAVSKSRALYVQLHTDIAFAKREFAWGKLDSQDIKKLWSLLRLAFLPFTALSSSMKLVSRLGTDQDWGVKDNRGRPTRDEIEGREQLSTLMKTLHQPFADYARDIELAIEHALLTLELRRQPKAKLQDEESTSQRHMPGSAGFTEWYSRRVENFRDTQDRTLEAWAKKSDIELPPRFVESTSARFESPESLDEDHYGSCQQWLFLALHLEYLLWRASLSVLDLVLYVDQQKQDGALRHNRLIIPGSKTLYKWLITVTSSGNHANDSQITGEMDAGSSYYLNMAAHFTQPRDPEHLPPRNAFEKAGDHLRKIPEFFQSDVSSFGMRVTVATMSIAIVCYLHSSQLFFIKQRLLWAMIMISISMTRTAGQSALTFLLRIIGSVIAMIGAYLVWYIVDGHTVGVFVFLWLWMVMCFYFMIKMPKYTVVAVLSLVTVVLIVGYELQVKVIGKEASEANGQPAYETYLLAPYRLATVAGGLFVAYFWTIFPHPVGESSELRRDVSSTLYLTSVFCSIISETVESRVAGTDDDMANEGSHAYCLSKAHDKVISRLMLLIERLRLNANFSKMQIHVGGKFPRQEYER